MQSVPRPSDRWRPRRAGLPCRGAQGGVALFEVLVSILIFSFGLLGLIGLEATAINFSVDAEDRTRASMFASEIASTMWRTNSVTPTAAQLTTWQTNIASAATQTGLPGGLLTITNGTTNSADITITWVPLTDKTNANMGATRTLTTRVILP